MHSETCSANIETVPSDTCKDLPPPRTPLGKRLPRMRWRMARIFLHGEILDYEVWLCPAYTGGAGRPVAVDGKLRTPACFGSRGEPWAQPLGLGRMCEPDFDSTALVYDTRRDHLYFEELFT